MDTFPVAHAQSILHWKKAGVSRDVQILLALSVVPIAKRRLPGDCGIVVRAAMRYLGCIILIAKQLWRLEQILFKIWYL